MYECELRGIHFRQPEEKEYASALNVGSRLSLVREPTNEYDMYAIRVIARVGEDSPLEEKHEYHLGYVAKEVTVWLAPEMDASEDEAFFAIVTGFEQRGKTTYPMLKIGSAEEIEHELQEINFIED